MLPVAARFVRRDPVGTAVGCGCACACGGGGAVRSVLLRGRVVVSRAVPRREDSGGYPREEPVEAMVEEEEEGERRGRGRRRRWRRRRWWWWGVCWCWRCWRRVVVRVLSLTIRAGPRSAVRRTARRPWTACSKPLRGVKVIPFPKKKTRSQTLTRPYPVPENVSQASESTCAPRPVFAPVIRLGEPPLAWNRTGPCMITQRRQPLAA